MLETLSNSFASELSLVFLSHDKWFALKFLLLVALAANLVRLFAKAIRADWHNPRGF